MRNNYLFTHTSYCHAYRHVEEEEEENLFTKKAGCQKGLQPINAGYHTHGETKKPKYTNITC